MQQLVQRHLKHRGCALHQLLLAEAERRLPTEAARQGASLADQQAERERNPHWEAESRRCPGSDCRPLVPTFG